MKTPYNLLYSVVVLVFAFSASAREHPVTGEELSAVLSKDKPTKGNRGAPVTLIEFSDFQCGFCRKFWQTTLPRLEKKYIKGGKLKFVYLHFAILGRHSVAAAQAADCAGEQGKFWEFHDKLFSVAGRPLAFTESNLTGYAKELGLKPREFTQCVSSGRYSKKVGEETAIAAYLGATGTPAFLLNRQLILGAQPFEVFEAVIEKELKKPASSEKTKP